MKGIYALAVRLNHDVRLSVGALGETSFRKGIYIYVGSAQANLEQRVRRHLRNEKRLFWHIDYLLDNPEAKIEKTFWTQGNKSMECKIAKMVSEHGEPVAGFGCSDCHCVSHLFRVENTAFLLERMKPLNLER